MTRRLLGRARASLLVPVLVPVLVLTGCSGGGDEPGDEPEPSGSAATDEDYLPVPEGVELTAQGSELALGETATVAYEPRQDEVAVLDLTVTSLEAATFEMFVGWKLSKETRKTAPYFVRVQVENVGETDLGGNRVPLYAVDGNNKLIESSTFASAFKPCPSESFPKNFGPGRTFQTCLVYLAPDKGDLTAASFRPVEEFNPIIWTGEVTKAAAKNKDGKKSKGKENKGKKGNKR